MRRALVVLALASTGCMFHVWRAKHAPGIVELEQPPQPLTHVETPKDPGKTSDVVYGSFGMGGFLQRGGGGLALDTEVGIWLQLESDRSDRATIADAPLRGSFSRKMPALGTAFGFTFYRELRGSDNALFGPIHYEVRTALPFSSTGSFGVARPQLWPKVLMAQIRVGMKPAMARARIPRLAFCLASVAPAVRLWRQPKKA